MDLFEASSMPPPTLSISEYYDSRDTIGDEVDSRELLRMFRICWNEYYQGILSINFRQCKQALDNLAQIFKSLDEPFHPVIEYCAVNDVISTIVIMGLKDNPPGLLPITAKFLALLAGHMPPAFFIPQNTLRTPILIFLKSIDVTREGDERTLDSVVRMAGSIVLLIAANPHMAELFVVNNECSFLEILWVILLLKEKVPQKLTEISAQTLSSLISSTELQMDSLLVKFLCERLIKKRFLIEQIETCEQLISGRQSGDEIVIAFVEGFKSALTDEIAMHALERANRSEFLIPAVNRLIINSLEKISTVDLLKCLDKAPHYFFSTNCLNEQTKLNLKAWKGIVDPLTKKITNESYNSLLSFGMTTQPCFLRNDSCRNAIIHLLRKLPLIEAVGVASKYPLTPDDLRKIELKESGDEQLALILLYSWQRLALNNYISVTP
jgi:hypothetical protein